MFEISPITTTFTCGRNDPRTNLFAMATLCIKLRTTPVKIRNISQAGALVEGDVIPSPATEVFLRRGSLAAKGKIVWSKGNRGGLKFDSPVEVTDWLPRGKGLGSQQQVDEMVQQVRAGPALRASHEPSSAGVSTLELARVQKLLISLADDLADDIDVLMRHGDKLQCLDLASQILGKMMPVRI